MIKVKKKTRIIHFKRPASRSNFTTIVYLMSKIHKLLLTRKTTTRRELYYKNLKMFRSQKEVDEGMKDVSFMLKVPAWALRVLATSKGIVSGPLTLNLGNGEIVDCSIKGGVQVPSSVLEIENMSSDATWVLIIEKDASFQSVIDNEGIRRIGPCIVITGKGFPDVYTRMLVCKFWEYLQIPILALVDADPYGFEIMCVYRFGSVTMSSHSEYLACPAVRWLGVHPSDIKPLLLEAESLSVRDIRKIQHLLRRCYVEENETLKNQLKILLEENAKAEIEGVSNISTTYLIDVYVRNKVQCREYF